MGRSDWWPRSLPHWSGSRSRCSNTDSDQEQIESSIATDFRDSALGSKAGYCSLFWRIGLLACRWPSTSSSLTGKDLTARSATDIQIPYLSISISVQISCPFNLSLSINHFRTNQLKENLWIFKWENSQTH